MTVHPAILNVPRETAPIFVGGHSASLSGQIVAQVRDALFARKLKPGDFLGTEKDLAARFGVSRIVARDALRTLQALGIADIRMGKGGGARVARGNPRLFAEALAVQLDLTGVSVAEIMDAQRAIETLAAELAAEHAIVRSLRDREVKVARQPGEGIEVADRLFGLTQQSAQFGDVGGGRILGGELGAERLDGALRIHDLGGGNAGEIELHGERFREQARIALGDARAAAFAHADLDDAKRLESAQGIARHDAACVETGGKVFFGAEEVAGLELFGEERVADPGNDLRRQR